MSTPGPEGQPPVNANDSPASPAVVGLNDEKFFPHLPLPDQTEAGFYDDMGPEPSLEMRMQRLDAEAAAKATQELEDSEIPDDDVRALEHGRRTGYYRLGYVSALAATVLDEANTIFAGTEQAFHNSGYFRVPTKEELAAYAAGQANEPREQAEPAETTGQPQPPSQATKLPQRKPGTSANLADLPQPPTSAPPETSTSESALENPTVRQRLREWGQLDATGMHQLRKWLKRKEPVDGQPGASTAVTEFPPAQEINPADRPVLPKRVSAKRAAETTTQFAVTDEEPTLPSPNAAPARPRITIDHTPETAFRPQQPAEKEPYGTGYQTLPRSFPPTAEDVLAGQPGAGLGGQGDMPQAVRPNPPLSWPRKIRRLLSRRAKEK
jgi:hypothetical protein